MTELSEPTVEKPPLFHGQHFLITHGISTENESGFCQFRIKRIIEQHGGTVQEMGEVTNTDNTYMITDQPYSTMKFLYGLSLNISPINYMYISDSVRLMTLQNPLEYMLPAGPVCDCCDKDFPFIPRKNVLAGYRISVYDDEHAIRLFSKFYKVIINNMGGTYVKLPAVFHNYADAFTKEEEHCDYVLLRKGVQNNTLIEAAHKANVIPVWPQWILHALMEGSPNLTGYFEVTLSTQEHNDEEKDKQTSSDSE